jgi:hypothetical protein
MTWRRRPKRDFTTTTHNVNTAAHPEDTKRGEYFPVTPGSRYINACAVCGCGVFDRDRHIAWHEENA